MAASQSRKASEAALSERSRLMIATGTRQCRSKSSWQHLVTRMACRQANYVPWQRMEKSQVELERLHAKLGAAGAEVSALRAKNEILKEWKITIP